MSRKIRVLFVIPTLDVGGAEMDLVHNAPQLDPDRFDVIVCTLLRRGKLEPRLAEAGITMIGPLMPERPPAVTRTRSGWYVGLWRVLRPMRNLDSVSWQKLSGVSPYLSRGQRLKHLFVGLLPAHWLMFIRLTRLLVSYIRAAEIDVVHTILPSSYVAGGIACVLTGRQLVMSRLSQNWYQQTQPVYRVLERMLMHRFVRVAIGNSRQIIGELREEGIASDRLRLVYNGIPIAQFRTSMGERATTRAALGLAADSFVMTTIGTLWPYKGQADLLDALAMASLPQGWVLLLAGRDIDGQRARLEDQCAQLGLGAHIRFLGERGDVPALLGAADLHVTASHTEGVPNNVLEAMCAGLAVVATDVGGIPELVVDGQTGILVPSQDPPALAAAIAALAADGPRRTRMGAEARRRVVDSFSIEASVAALDAIYTGLGAAGRGRAGR